MCQAGRILPKKRPRGATWMANQMEIEDVSAKQVNHTSYEFLFFHHRFLFHMSNLTLQKSYQRNVFVFLYPTSFVLCLAKEPDPSAAATWLFQMTFAMLHELSVWVKPLHSSANSYSSESDVNHVRPFNAWNASRMTMVCRWSFAAYMDDNCFSISFVIIIYQNHVYNGVCFVLLGQHHCDIY